MKSELSNASIRRNHAIRRAFRWTAFGFGLIPLLILGQNCSQPADLSIQEHVDEPSALEEAVKINDGSGIANSPDLVLSLGLQHAREVYITQNQDCQNGGVWQPIQERVNYRVDGPDETKFIYVKFRNQSQRETPCMSHKVIVDTQAPQILINVEPPSIGRERDIEFALEANDNLTGVEIFECRFNQEPFSVCSHNPKRLQMPDGRHAFEVRAMDRAGNEAQIVRKEFVVDADVPTLKLTSVPPAYTKSRSASIGIETDDRGGGIASLQCKIDSGPFTPCQSPLKLSNLADGRHTVTIEARDIADNVITTGAAWVVDNVAPVLTFKEPTKTLLTTRTVSFVAEAIESSANGSGVAKYFCQLDNKPEMACTSHTTITLNADGSHTYKVRAVDRAGNQASEQVSFMVDTIPPVIALDNNPPSKVTGSSITIDFNVSDPGAITGAGSGLSHFKYQLDNNAQVYSCQAAASCQFSQTFTGLPAGAHRLWMRAYDKAGNDYITTFHFTTK